MSGDDPRVTVLACECAALRQELAKVRAENETLRKHQVEARHHIAMALRGLNGDLPPDTQRFHNGG